MSVILFGFIYFVLCSGWIHFLYPTFFWLPFALVNFSSKFLHFQVTWLPFPIMSHILFKHLTLSQTNVIQSAFFFLMCNFFFFPNKIVARALSFSSFNNTDEECPSFLEFVSLVTYAEVNLQKRCKNNAKKEPLHTYRPDSWGLMFIAFALSISSCFFPLSIFLDNLGIHGGHNALNIWVHVS